MWKTLFMRYWRICIFKDKPENTPYSPLLLAVSALFFCSLITVEWLMADVKQTFRFSTAMLASICLFCAYFIYTFFLLKIYHKANRTIQTLNCLLVSHFYIHLFAFPLLLMTPALLNGDIDKALILLMAIFYLIMTLVLTIWQFLVTTHIYKYALELDYFGAVLTSFGLMATSILTVSFWQ